MQKIQRSSILRNVLLLLFSSTLLFSCTNYRFVIEPYDGDRALRETTVLADDGVSERAGDKIAMISFEGLIALGDQPSLFGTGRNPVSDFVESLDKARKDGRVKAVILSINSPGGTVTASDILYREVKRFKAESKKPVVVLMGEVAASGGYYLSCAGDEIIARPTTITGSIGVIIQTINFSEGLSRIGIRADSITSGPNKSMGSPFEPEQPEHRRILREMVNEFYGRFVGIVRENRPSLNMDELPTATDGRVVTGAQAVRLGLVDSTGYLTDAFKAAKRRAGIDDGARLVKYHRASDYVPTAYSSTSASAHPTGGSAQRAGAGARGITSNFNLVQLNAFNGGGSMSSLIPQPGPTAFYLWSAESVRKMNTRN